MSRALASGGAGIGLGAGRLGAGIRLRLTALDPLRLSLFLLTIVTISRIHQHYGFIGKFRPALLLVGFAFAYAIVQPRALASGSLLRTWPAKVLAGLGVTACLSAIFGISLGSAATFILDDYSKVLIYAFLLIAIMAGARDVRLIVWAYVIACGILVWMAVFVFQLTRGYGSAIARLNNLHTYDANDIGCVLLVGLPLAMLTLQTSRGWGRGISLLIIVGTGVALARSGSRGAFVGLMCVGLALLFLLDRVSVVKRVGFLLTVVLALAIAAPPGYWEQMRSLTNPKDDYNWSSVDGRKQVAERGLGYLLQYPAFGIGINNFPRAEGLISSKARDHVPGTGLRWGAAHNSFIQAGAEMGVPGLALWCPLIFGGIGGMLRLRRRLPRAWATGDEEARFLYLATLYLPVAVIGFAVTSFFVSFAYLDPIYILAALMTGTYVSVDGRRRRVSDVGVAAATSALGGRHAGWRSAR